MASHPFPAPRDESVADALAVRRPRSPSFRDRTRLGVRAGLFAAAATAGAIVGFARDGAREAAAPFVTNGRMLLGVAAGDSAAVQVAAFVGGAALHVALVVGWALLFALVAGAQRGVRLLAAALLFGAAAWGASERVLPPLLRLGHGVRAFPLQVALLYAVLSLGLALGMRIAFSSRARGAGE